MKDEIICEVPPPPRIPSGYQATGNPASLLTVNDERWMVACIQVSTNERGFLIYEERRALIFLVTDEARVFSKVLSQEQQQDVYHGEDDAGRIHRLLQNGSIHELAIEAAKWLDYSIEAEDSDPTSISTVQELVQAIISRTN